MKKLIFVLTFLLMAGTAQAKIINIKTSALGLAFGSTSFTGYLGLTSNFAVGVSYSSDSTTTSEYTALEFSAEYFFNSFSSDSWYIEAFFGNLDLTSKSTAGLSATSSKYGAFIAKQWMWSYINTSVGVGYGMYSANADFVSFSGGYPVLVWTLGVAF